MMWLMAVTHLLASPADAGARIVLRGNLPHDIVRKSGIAPDNGTSGWLIERNASYDIPEGGHRWNNTGPEPGQTGPQLPGNSRP